MSKYQLLVSFDNGISYDKEYETDNRNDPELSRLITQAQNDMVPYIVQGDKIESHEQANAILADGTYGLWFTEDKDGNIDIEREKDHDRTHVEIDGILTRKELQAILFLMDNPK